MRPMSDPPYSVGEKRSQTSRSRVRNALRAGDSQAEVTRSSCVDGDWHGPSAGLNIDGDVRKLGPNRRRQRVGILYGVSFGWLSAHLEDQAVADRRDRC